MKLKITVNGVDTLHIVHWMSCIRWHGAWKMVASVHGGPAGGKGYIVDLDDPDIDSFSVSNTHIPEDENLANITPEFSVSKAYERMDTNAPYTMSVV